MTAPPSAHLQRPTPLLLGARRLYLILAGLFAVGVVFQVFFAGLGVLVAPSYFGWHTTFAHLLELALLALPVVGLFGRVGWRSFGLNALLFVLFGMQYFFMYGLQGPLRALHVVNALALFWLALELVRGAWRLVSTTRLSGVASPPRGKAVGGRLLAGGIAIVLGAAVLFGVVFDNGPGFIRTENPTEQDRTPEPAATTQGETSAAGGPLYAQHCAGCHGEVGNGGFGPALAGNDNLAKAEAIVTQILGGGGGMPAFDGLSDEAIAALGSYIRSSWSNDFGPITAADVAEQR